MKNLILVILAVGSCCSKGISQDFNSSFKIAYLFVDNIYRNPRIPIDEGLGNTEVIGSSAIKISGVNSKRLPWRRPNMFRKKKSWTDIELGYDLRAYQANPRLNTLQIDLSIENRHRWSKKYITRLSANYIRRNAKSNVQRSNRRVIPFAYSIYDVATTQDLILGKYSRIWLDTYYKHKNYIHRSSLDRVEIGGAIRYRYKLSQKKKEYWRLSGSVSNRRYLNQSEPGVFDEDGAILANSSDQRVFTYADLHSSLALKPTRTLELKTGVEFENRSHYGSGKLSYQDLEAYVALGQNIHDITVNAKLSISKRSYSNYAVNDHENLVSQDRKLSISVSKLIAARLEFGLYVSHFSRTSNNPKGGSLFFDGYSTTYTSLSLKYTF